MKTPWLTNPLRRLREQRAERKRLAEKEENLELFTTTMMVAERLREDLFDPGDFSHDVAVGVLTGRTIKRCLGRQLRVGDLAALAGAVISVSGLKLGLGLFNLGEGVRNAAAKEHYMVTVERVAAGLASVLVENGLSGAADTRSLSELMTGVLETWAGGLNHIRILFGGRDKLVAAWVSTQILANELRHVFMHGDQVDKRLLAEIAIELPDGTVANKRYGEALRAGDIAALNAAIVSAFLGFLIPTESMGEFGEIVASIAARVRVLRATGVRVLDVDTMVAFLSGIIEPHHALGLEEVNEMVDLMSAVLRGWNWPDALLFAHKGQSADIPALFR